MSQYVYSDICHRKYTYSTDNVNNAIVNIKSI